MSKGFDTILELVDEGIITPSVLTFGVLLERYWPSIADECLDQVTEDSPWEVREDVLKSYEDAYFGPREVNLTDADTVTSLLSGGKSKGE